MMKRELILILAVTTFISVSRAQQAPAQASKPAGDAAAAEHARVEALEAQVAHDEKWLLDWAELARYREANAGVHKPAKGERRVVFMGDSITDGWSQPHIGGFFPGKPYLNRGISGQTTPQMLIRFRPDVIALQPEAVIILAGTNDIAGNTGPMSLEETEGNLASMAELARAHGIRVVLCSVMPVSDEVTTPEGKKYVQTEQHPPEKIIALNQWIKQFAAAHGHAYVDYFGAMVDEHGFLKSVLTYDGLHPNPQGYAVMAPLAEKAIKKALSRKR